MYTYIDIVYCTCSINFVITRRTTHHYSSGGTVIHSKLVSSVKQLILAHPVSVGVIDDAIS